MRAVWLRLLLLVPALVGAVEVPRVPNVGASLSAPKVNTAPVAPLAGPILPPSQLLPSGLQPGQIPAIPALPAAAVPQAEPLASAPLAVKLGEAARFSHGSRRGYLPWHEGLELLRRASLEAAEGKSEGDASRAHFDGGATFGGSAFSATAGWAPSVPAGVGHVEVDEVTTARDIDRLIPDGTNSRELISQLKIALPRMRPYRVYTYHDSRGGRFTGIDLSQKPDLVEVLPEQHSHEVALIKKIQLFNKDLQVVVREDGKTPDLVMGGMVTELKSLIGTEIDLGFLVNKANTQVYKHAQRHGLGDGAVAVDLTAEERVPVDRAVAEINAWAARPTGDLVKRQRNGEEIFKDRNALQKIYVFAKLDMKVFERQPDGSYSLSGQKGIPFVSPGTRIKRDAHTAQFLIKKKRRRAAANLVGKARQVEKRANIGRRFTPLEQAKERIDALRFLEGLKKLARRRRFASARALWDNYRSVKPPEVVHEIRDAVGALLADETEGELMQREIDGPRAQLKKLGVRATITVYGSARLEPGSHWYEEARKFGGLVAGRWKRAVAVVTGGGPGIMEAANRGAHEAGGRSIGHNIVLPQEQQPNPYQSQGLSFDYESFGARKSNMRHLAGAHVYFPGGFGTMDELFELLTLMQTGKIERSTIVLVGGREYWDDVLDFKAFGRLGLISPEDLDLFVVVEDADEAFAAVKNELVVPR